MTVKTALTVGFKAEGGGTTAYETDNALAVIGWLLGDQLIARLDQEISACSDDAQALTATERAAQEKKILADLLMLERQEENIVEAIGGHVARRPDTSPVAVMSLSSALPRPHD